MKTNPFTTRILTVCAAGFVLAMSAGNAAAAPEIAVEQSGAPAQATERRLQRVCRDESGPSPLSAKAWRNPT